MTFFPYSINTFIKLLFFDLLQKYYFSFSPTIILTILKQKLKPIFKLTTELVCTNIERDEGTVD